MPVSGEQQRDAAIQTDTWIHSPPNCPLFQAATQLITLSRVPYATAGLLLIQFKYCAHVDPKLPISSPHPCPWQPQVRSEKHCFLMSIGHQPAMPPQSSRPDVALPGTRAPALRPLWESGMSRPPSPSVPCLSGELIMPISTWAVVGCPTWLN